MPWHKEGDSNTSWMRKAECKDYPDPEDFFPERGASTTKAKAVCRQCPVIENCLDYAIKNHMTHGVWGGMSSRERRRVNRMRKAS